MKNKPTGATIFRLAEPRNTPNSSLIRDDDGSAIVDVNTKFWSGVYDGYTILQVYKVHPEHINWKMINLDWFIIKPEALELLKKIQVFDLFDLLKKNLVKQPGNGTRFVDFSNITLEGELYQSKEIVEVPFKISELAERKNLEKFKATSFYKKLNNELLSNEQGSYEDWEQDDYADSANEDFIRECDPDWDGDDIDDFLESIGRG